MTQLAEVLDSCRDTVFKVSFKKKLDQKNVEEKIATMKLKDLKDGKSLHSLSKSLIEGESCEITGHLLSVDTYLGRSVVIDLNAPKGLNYRQVDHRTIDFIVFKNVKYTLSKKSDGEVPLKHEKSKPRWNSTNLAVGNWFSQVVYYKVNSIDDENVKVQTSTSSTELTLSKDILVTEMNSGSAFAGTEKISRTDMVEKLLDAKESVMKIKFHKKIDEAWVKDILTDQIKTKKHISDAKHVKKVAKELITGQDVEMTCHLSTGQPNLGRSLILDLDSRAGMNYRQVDHRTLEELTLHNKKYVLK